MGIKPAYHNIFKEKKNKNIMCLWNPPQVYQSNLTYHREFEFHYIKRGKGSYFIKNRKYPFTHNNLIVIKSGEIHRFIPLTPYVYIEKGSLYLSPSFVKNREMKDIIDSSPHILKLGEKEATLIEVIFRNIADEMERQEANWEEIVHYQVMLFIYILKRCFLRKHPTIRENPRIEKIISFIEENFTKDISLSDIAKSFYISTSHLSHLFKRETGLSVKRYILQRRIMEAKKLLTEKYSEKVSAIAQQVGFSDFALFNRSFKKITGLTPSGYRRTSGRI